MRSAHLLTALVFLAGSPAHAVTYQLAYAGGALAVAKGYLGVPGATRLRIVYSLPSLPSAGQCTASNITSLPKSYSDGSNTITSLTASGYTISTILSFCIAKTGTKIASWSFALSSYSTESRLPYYAYDASTSHKVGTKTPDSVTWDAPSGYYMDTGRSGVWRLKTVQ
jgi:hypothetical protein